MNPARERILAGYGRAAQGLRIWLQGAGPADLRRRSQGTRWTKEELHFHMVFGHMVVRALLPLVHIVSRLPQPAGRGFAVLLNAGTRPFDAINYWGSRAAAVFYNRHRMIRKLEKTTAAISRRLEHETGRSLSRSMPFPDRWDLFFASSMSVLDVYAYPTLHFDFHAEQLSFGQPGPQAVDR